MVVEITEQDLALLYEKARKSFLQCISNPDNAYLQDEVNIPLEQIVAQGATVKAVFLEQSNHLYAMEVCLVLHAKEDVIGRYDYSENEAGEPIEDGLVFY
jgi:hypothetical protein